jgi:hypothetical protein
MLSVFVLKSAFQRCVKISGRGKILVQGQWGDYQRGDGKGKAISKKIGLVDKIVSSPVVFVLTRAPPIADFPRCIVLT